MIQDYKFPVRGNFDFTDERFTVDPDYKRWKQAYGSGSFIPTEEEQSYIDMLRNLVPSVLPFHVKIVDFIKGSIWGDCSKQTCTIRLARRMETQVFTKPVMESTAIHELCHYIDFYHTPLSGTVKYHTKRFCTAVYVLEAKKHLIYSDFDPKDFPPIEELRKNADKDKTDTQVYAEYKYNYLCELYSEKYNDWNVDTLCKLFGVDLKNGILLDR